MQADDHGLDHGVWVDWVNECVWRRGEAVRVTPKAFAVLRVLTARAGQLVTKEELLQAIWSEAVVHEAVLTVCIGELRKALHVKRHTETARPLPVQRSFVMQLSAEADVAQGHFAGRVEHVISGYATHFQTPEDLLGFMARVLTGGTGTPGDTEMRPQ